MFKYAKKEIINFEKIKINFKSCLSCIKNIVRQGSYGTKAKYAAVFEDFYTRRN